MDAIITPFLLSQGAELIRSMIQRSADATQRAQHEAKEKAAEDAARNASKEAILFWIKEELSYNLDILRAWGGSGDDFALSSPQVRRLCRHLQTEICSLVLSDKDTMEILRSTLTREDGDHLKFEAESEVGEKKKRHEGLESLLFILRKVAVLQRITEDSAHVEADIPQSFNFNVRLKNIKKAHLALYNYLKEYEG